MRELIWGKTFIKALKRHLKRNPDSIKDIERVLDLLINDPFKPNLSTHKLKGKLTGSWACCVGYDLRIIFDFVESNKNEKDILLIEIGSHEEVY
ncbi:MAG: type II toxin-antitoxin system mRNA interferase toxin, RelE/StbE family [Nitrospirae bacterium]|nr:type II toxin-antitoxin system mRNA interferase toxin, RelE/StbE family [Nitrospirota bacterium]MBF0535200.1 type II toxin-antitoxin system mRNA interferase toxin, RelE/StbE family [Nitrospirota bacterium]MBF0615181.1 type II toxin-antitoxin system mRNA interferase toxin, RelE/StbE family [Nitrospirota bacterium]